MDGDLDRASAADAVTVVLADNVDVSRGDIISSVEKPAQRADAFAAHLVWMSKTPLLPGRSYLLKAGGQSFGAMVTELKYRIDIENFGHLAAKECISTKSHSSMSQPPNRSASTLTTHNRDTGGFILIDRHTNATVAAGLIRFGLRRAANTYFQAFEVTKTARARLNAQKPALLWFTGLSGAGNRRSPIIWKGDCTRSASARFVLDGDNVRHGLNRDLGFTRATVSRTFAASRRFRSCSSRPALSPWSPSSRRSGRSAKWRANWLRRASSSRFLSIRPFEACERRDPKGLYKKARRGELRNFTGLDSPYEPPSNPELTLDALHESPSDLADRIIGFMQQRGILVLKVDALIQTNASRSDQ